MPIKVLVIDDSALVRMVVTKILEADPEIKVVGQAPNPIVARDMIKQTNPDVLTLDVEMPRMDGLDFLERLMRLRPMPVVMVSSLTEEGSDITLRALELGAIDYITKARMGISESLMEQGESLVEKVKVAARAKVRQLPAMGSTQTGAPVAAAVERRRHFSGSEKLIFVGASTGGTEAIREFLEVLPEDAPGILITQHMPEMFTKSFADRLDRCCRISVKEAQADERVLPGHAYIAPGNFHLSVRRSGANYVCHIDQNDPVNRHRPSVDVLFHSAAQAVGANAVGVILTGMGRDGAQGMLEMKKAGSYNFGQDENTCVVYGMPREAFLLGAVDEQLPLQRIAGRVLDHIEQGGRALRV